MKYCFVLLSSLLILGTTAIVQAQQHLPAAGVATVIPADYPKYTHTGNPQEDNKRYTEAKRAWVAANPQAYAKMIGQQQAAGSENQMEDKLRAIQDMPTAKPSEMIPPYNPEQFEKDRQKEQAKAIEEIASQAANPTLEQPAPATAIKTEVPTHPIASGYNNKNAVLEEEKIEVAASIPEVTSTVGYGGLSNEVAPASEITHTINFPDFPKYINTGKPEEDRANYDKAKQAWISTHSDEYAKMNLPEKGTAKHLISKQEFDNMPVEKQQKIFQNSDLYVIGNVQNNEVIQESTKPN